MKINIPATLIYLMLLYLINLARGAIGGFFVYIYYIILILPVASTLHLILSLVSLRYIQDFSSFHSIRGDKVSYQLKISQEFPMFSANISIAFKNINPNVDSGMSDFSITLRPGERQVFDYSIPCPYIGVYTIGLEGLRVSDVFGWLTLPLSVFYYTMYVYPRVLDTGGFTLAALTNRSTAGSRLGTAVDYSYFERLEEYRPGQNVRLMAWKRFSATGVAMLRQYNRVSTPGCRIYLDTQRLTGREDGENRDIIEREDFSMELMMSIAAGFLDQSVPVDVRIPGLPPHVLRHPDDLQELLRTSLEIRFRPDADFLEQFSEDGQQAGGPSGTVLFITHRLSPELIRVLSRPPGGMNTIEAIVNETAADTQETELNRRRIIPLGSAGNLVRFTATEQIRENSLIWQ